MARKLTKVALDKLAQERLPRQLLADTQAIELEIWERTSPGLSLTVGNGELELRLVVRTQTRKFLTWLSGGIAAVTAITAIARWLIPIVLAHYSTSPP